ncbi:hypothetical protein DSO57_1033018 [Entomophthora muscae]|uniref:Uncharacterized protein n=1 Tax=Entomophthora muscae TaxID=34485 RepID=A0ACC2T046_9FUNG|nr:hypothetical protein DSO57_1033018 [Entomophthora muscae]
MLEIPPTSPFPTVPPAQDFTTAVNYLARIAPIVYLAFQARTASPAGIQPDSGMGHDNYIIEFTLVQCMTSFSDEVMFSSYYKLSIAFDKFDEQGKAPTQKERKKVKKGMFIGVFLAVSARGFVCY